MKKLLTLFVLTLLPLCNMAEEQGYAVFDQASGILTFKYGEKPSGYGIYATDNTQSQDDYDDIGDTQWENHKLKKVVFDPSFVNARPKSLAYWFDGATSLTEIEGLQYLNTSSVSNMSNMFRACFNLVSLDLSSFDTSNVTNMDFMFAYCDNLKRIYVGNLWSTSNLNTGSYMFYECNNLKGGNGTKYVFPNNDYHFAHIDTEASPGYFSDIKDKDKLEANDENEENEENEENKEIGYAEFDETSGTLTFKYGVKPQGDNVFETENTASSPKWECSKIKKVIFESSFANERPKSTCRWFNGAQSLTEIVELKNLNTSEVTDMSAMFYGCSSLTSLDLSSFNTSKVTNMGSMFSYCYSLTSLDVSSFDTSNVTNMESMFFGCYNLTDVDLSVFKKDPKELGFPVRAYCVFEAASGTLTFKYGMKPSGDNVYDPSGGWNKESVKKMVFDSSYAQEKPDYFFSFEGSSSLTEIEGLQYLNTSSILDMGRMFEGCGSLVSLDLSHFDTSNVTDMSSMFYGCSNLTSLDLSHFDTSNVTDMGFMFSGCNSLSSLNLSNFNTGNVTKMLCMFENCSHLKTLDLNSFNTAKVEDMGWMFSGCNSLLSLSLNNFTTSEVTNMRYMFNECQALGSLDLSHFGTGKVTNMDRMFYGCSSLNALDCSSFDTSNVTDMNGMFSGCSSLNALDCSSFDTSNVTDMNGMFYGCSSLTTLDLSSFNTSRVTNMGFMFGGCSSLTTLDCSNFDISHVTDMNWMFQGCTSLTDFDYSKFGIEIQPETPSIDDHPSSQYRGYAYFDEDAGTLTFKYGIKPSDDDHCFDDEDPNVMWDKKKVKKVIFDPSYAQATPGMINHWFNWPEYCYFCENPEEIPLEEIIGLEYLNTSNVMDMGLLFHGCTHLKSLDLSHFNTSNVTRMGDMFNGCISLTTLDCSSFDTSNVTDMGSMFNGCENLVSLNLSGFNTSNVTYMSCMFENCRSLQALDLSSFDTSQVTNMLGMFRFCFQLKSLNVCHFNTSLVTDFRDMFCECNNLESLDLSNFDTSSAEHMSSMFANCSSLTNLNLSRFNVKKVKKLFGMFSGCSNLKTLDISHFDTQNAETTWGMFQGCSSLTSLDLTSFDTRKIVDAVQMFYCCYSLRTIYVSDKWDFSNQIIEYEAGNLTEFGGEFADCYHLVGGSGTVYNARYSDIRYANVDGGPDYPGYLTAAYSEKGVTYTSTTGTASVVNVSAQNEEVDIPSGMIIDGQTVEVTTIGDEAFKNNDKLKIVSIPESIEGIGESAFAGCSDLKAIYCYADEPIALGSSQATVRTRAGGDEVAASSVFDKVNKTECTLYVPAASIDKYRNASGWKEFTHIRQIPSDVKGDANNDWTVDLKDAKVVGSYILKKEQPEDFVWRNADGNNDKKINVADIVKIVNIMQSDNK